MLRMYVLYPAVFEGVNLKKEHSHSAIILSLNSIQYLDGSYLQRNVALRRHFKKTDD